MTLKKERVKLNERVNINFTVAREIKDFLQEGAVKNGVSLSAYITMFIQNARTEKTAMENLALLLLKNVSDEKVEK